MLRISSTGNGWMEDCENMSKIKVLILSSTPWNNNNSFGHSYSNIFGGLENNLEFANIYCSSGISDVPLVGRSFQITEKELIANIKNRNRTVGKEIYKDFSNAVHLSAKEKMNRNKIRQNRWQIFFWIRELIWTLGNWKSPQLQQFLDDYRPDILFLPVYYSSYLNRMAAWLKSDLNIPAIGYISDDNYTLKQWNFSPLYWMDRLWKRRYVKQTIDFCDELFVISDIQKREYDRIFHKNSIILTKLATAQTYFAKNMTLPFRFFYAGGLSGDRWRTLKIFIDELGKFNSNRMMGTITIATNTPLPEFVTKKLSVAGTSIFKGFITLDEMENYIRNSDILIHADGFSLQYRYKYRHSFSTKIIDYLASGNTTLALGPKGAASIDHLIENRAAIVASGKKEVKQVLTEIFAHPAGLNEYRKNAVECINRFHEKSKMQNVLLETIIKVASKNENHTD